MTYTIYFAHFEKSAQSYKNQQRYKDQIKTLGNH